MLRVVVLVSGGGTNLQAILDAMDNGKIKNAEVVGVISNNASAYALTRAEKHNIPNECISPKNYENRDEFNQAINSYPNARLVLYGHIHYFTEVQQGHIKYSSSTSVGFAFDKDLPKFQIADGLEGFSLIEINSDIIDVANIQLYNKHVHLTRLG